MPDLTSQESEPETSRTNVFELNINRLVLFQRLTSINNRRDIVVFEENHLIRVFDDGAKNKQINPLMTSLRASVSSYSSM